MPRTTPPTAAAAVPRLTLRRLALAAMGAAVLGLAVLIAAVVAGWLTLPVAMLLGAAAATLAGLGVLALGVRRLLLRLHAGFQQTRTQLDQVRVVLADATGGLDQATTQVETALHDLRASSGEDRLELLQRLDQVSDQAARIAQDLRTTHAAQEEQARQAAEVGQAVRATQHDQVRREGALRRSVEAGTAAAQRARARLPDLVYAKVEAHLGLRTLVEARAPLPPLGGWALDADVLHAMAAIMWQRRPDLVVECGSGSSSVWLGYLVERLGHGRVVALEHDEHFLRSSRDLVAAHGLRDRVEIRHAPLEPWSPPWSQPGDPPQPWYAVGAIDDLKRIGLLLVDGPPEAVGEQARYPAGPLLIPRCTDDAVIVLDDTHRDGEQEVSRRWREEWPELRRMDTNRPLPADLLLRLPPAGPIADAGGPHGG
jgi:hypothetical protein